ncbi:MAG: methylenetetrahydrofolate reductase C-terminal domain-containing protein, partial [Planctomycetota bacterium]
SDFDFVGITVPQNPSGVPNLEPSDVLTKLKDKDLLDSLDFIPHISCKDANSGVLISSLVGFRNAGVESLLILTGDKPLDSKGVFELDSVGFLELIKRMNNESYIKARPENLDKVHQFFTSAAVSPFKYTEASQMQQYYKMEKKIAAGAEFIITQLGYDWRKSLELFRYLKERELNIPVIGNVYFLSTLTAAPRLMHDGELAGCFVSDELLEKIYSESVDEHIERAAQQVAMYKSIGAAGVDISGVHDYQIFTRILNRAAEIGTDWEQYKENLYWPRKNGFYLYDNEGEKVELTKSRKKFGQISFNFFHRAILDPDYRGFRVFRKTMKLLGAEKGKGVIYRFFHALEKFFKYLLFECESCGDCFLPENFGHCALGKCEKGLSNPPCGDATIEGYCGSNTERICIGELVYESASAEKGGLERLRNMINVPRNPELLNTSSILNYLFGIDHTTNKPWILIGESIHASIPKTCKIMKELSALGPDSYSEPSGPLNYIKALVESQVDQGADYIKVNLDDFGDSNPQTVIDMMIEYTKLVRKWSKGVPICIDSNNDNVLMAGLKEWYNTSEAVKQPLINSVKVNTMDKMFALKKNYDFSFIGLLNGNNKNNTKGNSCSADELYSCARRLFDEAVHNRHFQPEEIFFDTTVPPLTTDIPKQPNTPSFTYYTFEAIKKIKNDTKMKGVHCVLSISNAARNLPGRKIGVCRAYLAKATEYGLDAAIVNVAHDYKVSQAAPELLELVDAFSQMDGSKRKTDSAAALVKEFGRKNKKPSK